MKGYHLLGFRSVILLSLRKWFSWDRVLKKKKKEENCSECDYYYYFVELIVILLFTIKLFLLF